MTLRPATAEDCPRLSEVALAAKAHWGYPQAWLDVWREELTLTPEKLEAWRVTVAEVGGRIVGFAALGPATADRSLAELEHLWVDPESMGLGVGRRLMAAVVEQLRTLDVAGLEILSDPNAVGFYERLGARREGSVTGELLGQPRVLPRYLLDVAGTVSEAE